MSYAEIHGKFLKVRKSPPSYSVSLFQFTHENYSLFFPNQQSHFHSKKINIPHIYRILDFRNLLYLLHLALLHVMWTHYSSLLPAPCLSQSNLMNWVPPQTSKWATFSLCGFCSDGLWPMPPFHSHQGWDPGLLLQMSLHKLQFFTSLSSFFYLYMLAVLISHGQWVLWRHSLLHFQFSTILVRPNTNELLVISNDHFGWWVAGSSYPPCPS